MYRKHFRSRHHCLHFLVFALLLLFFASELSSCYYRSWPSLPFSLHFNPKYLVLAPGERHSLKINGIALKVSYQSSNPLNVTVTETGVLYAVSCGEATITATLHNRNNKKIKCRVIVTKLNKTKLTLKVGTYYYLKLTGIWQGLSYKSSAPSVVSVSRFGWLKAKKTGTAMITVTCHGKKFECTVTVP